VSKPKGINRKNAPPLCVEPVLGKAARWPNLDLKGMQLVGATRRGFQEAKRRGFSELAFVNARIGIFSPQVLAIYRAINIAESRARHGHPEAIDAAFRKRLIFAFETRDIKFFSLIVDVMQRMNEADAAGGYLDAFGASMCRAWVSLRMKAPARPSYYPSWKAWKAKLESLHPHHGYCDPYLLREARNLGIRFSDR
jgi:hypothetical protein